MPPPSSSPTEPRHAFDQVIVAGGHMTDRPGRRPPRFPPSDEPAVAAAVRSAMKAWDVGPGTLLVTAGARGADMIAAEQALALGAEVWLLLPLPDEQFIVESVHVDEGDWHERFRELRRRCQTWFQHDELGPLPAGEDVFERNNDWCVAAAATQAPAGRLQALVVWNGAPGDGPGGAADLVGRARARGALVEVVRPPSSAGDPA